MPTSADDGQDKAKLRSPTRILEVGAVNTQLVSYNDKKGVKLAVTAIDLLSTNPKIVQCDFLKMPLPEEPFHAVVCSMVLNSVPSAAQRGEMIVKLGQVTTLDGYCFVFLPLSCLTGKEPNSSVTKEAFVSIMEERANLKVVCLHETKKVFFYVGQKFRERPDKSGVQQRRERAQSNGRRQHQHRQSRFEILFN